MSGHVGLREDARNGALLAAQIACLFRPQCTVPRFYLALKGLALADAGAGWRYVAQSPVSWLNPVGARG
jgi:hypothetical protein